MKKESTPKTGQAANGEPLARKQKPRGRPMPEKAIMTTERTTLPPKKVKK